jgi:hypothetical protein
MRPPAELNDVPWYALRWAALRVVAALAGLLPAELRASVVEQLDSLCATDPVPVVRADAMVVLARFGRRTAALDSPLPEVRLAAALLDAERSGPPYAAELVEVIAEDGAEPDPEDDHFPWYRTPPPRSRSSPSCSPGIRTPCRDKAIRTKNSAARPEGSLLPDRCAR